MDDYEAKRQRAIAAKSKLAAQLGISKRKRTLEYASEELASKRKRARARARRRPTTDALQEQPMRRSLRVRGLTAEGEKVENPSNELKSLFPAPPSDRRERPEGDLLLNDVLGEESADVAKETLGRVLDTKEADLDPTAVDYSNLDIREEHHVLKVVPNRIYSIAFAPINSTVIAWCGEKWGRLGAWRPFVEDPENASIMLTPHSRAISSIACPPSHPHLVFTSSYDQSVRVLDAERGVCLEALLWDTLMTYCVVEDGGQIVWASSNDGEVVRVDRRESGGARGEKAGDSSGTASYHAPQGVKLHERKVGSVDLHPDGRTILTASLDGTACLWDVRRWPMGKTARSKPLASFAHDQGVSSAFFSPSGNRFVSTSHDDHLRIWEGGVAAKDPPSVSIPHNNHTGRWLSNFRTVWDPRDDSTLLIGAMGTREIEAFSATSGRRIAHRRSDYLTAVPTLNCVHPVLPYVVSGTASGRLHLWT